MKFFHIMKSEVDKLKPGINISMRLNTKNELEYDGEVHAKSIVSKYMAIYFVNKSCRFSTREFFAVYFIKLKTTGRWRISCKLAEKRFWKFPSTNCVAQ